MAWEQVPYGKGRGSCGAFVPYDLRLSRYTNGKISVTFSPQFMKKLKWQVGDRLSLLVDRKAGLLGIRRTAELAGRVISPSSGGSKRKGYGRMTMPNGEVFNMLVDNTDARILVAGSYIIDDDETVVIEFVKSNRSTHSRNRSKKEIEMDRMPSVDEMSSYLHERNWTIAKSGSQVLIYCENSDDALAVFNWLTEFASLKDNSCSADSSTQTLIAAIRILASEIHSDDGVANAAIAEAADALERIHNAAIDLLWYFYAADDRPTEPWPPAEALRQAVGISVEELRKQA